MKKKKLPPKKKLKAPKTQAELDREEHYDIDGVTQINGQTAIPQNLKLRL
jgi:hypothetical protein